jgi:hypothetical protein
MASKGWGSLAARLAAVAVALLALAACVTGQLLPEGQVLGGRYHREIVFPPDQIISLQDAPVRVAQIQVVFYYNRPDSYLPEAFISRRRSPMSEHFQILAVIRDKHARADLKRDGDYDTALEAQGASRAAAFTYQVDADGAYETQTGVDKAGKPLNCELFCLQPRWKTPLLMGLYSRLGALMYAVAKFTDESDTGFGKMDDVPLSQRVFYFQDLPGAVSQGPDGDLDTRRFGRQLVVFAGNLVSCMSMQLRARYPG